MCRRPATSCSNRLSTTGGALVLTASGKITLVDKQSPVMELNGRFEPLAIRDMLHYWPLDIGTGARDWIANNIFAGTIGPVVFETHLPAGALDLPMVPDGALLMSFPLTNVELNYVQGLTHMTGLNANAKLTGNSFDAEIVRARIGPLLLSKGRAVIPDLGAPGSPGDISAHIEGSMTDILKLTDLKPLNYATRFGIDPMATEGNAAVDLGFHIPMRKDLSVHRHHDGDQGGHHRLRHFARQEHAAVRRDAHLRRRQHASARLWQRQSRHIAPRHRLDRELQGGERGHHRGRRQGLLDQAGRDMLGFRAVDYLRGPVGVTGTLTGNRGQLTAGDLALDLTPSTLSLDLVGISKPMGFPASAHALLSFGPRSMLRTTNITIADRASRPR